MTKRNSLQFAVQSGCLDGVFQNQVVGWAWNSLTPDEPVDVDIYINGELDKTIKADRYREDLQEAGIGNGAHCFMYPLPLENNGSTYLLSVRLAGTTSEISKSPIWINGNEKLKTKSHLTTLKLDPDNIAFSLENLEAATIDHLLIDINDTCNAECVYCPNPRTKKRIELEQFQTLLDRCVEKVDTLQIGCGQEPTLDVRLPDFYRALHSSKLKPRRLTMITNATMLHRHDVDFFRDCGLTDLQISLDTVDPEINAMTRRGTELEQIVKNLRYFRQKCPNLGVIFSVVVHSLTIDGIEALIDFGDSLGVSRYYLREVFDHAPASLIPRNDDYKDWIKKIGLKPGEFQQMQQRLSRHRSIKKISFIAAEGLGSVLQDMRQADGSVRFS